MALLTRFQQEAYAERWLLPPEELAAAWDARERAARLLVELDQRLRNHHSAEGVRAWVYPPPDDAWYFFEHAIQGVRLALEAQDWQRREKTD